MSLDFDRHTPVECAHCNVSVRLGHWRPFSPGRMQCPLCANLMPIKQSLDHVKAMHGLYDLRMYAEDLVARS